MIDPEILLKIEELLNDKCEQVQVASAITLHALGKVNKKVRCQGVILRCSRYFHNQRITPTMQKLLLFILPKIWNHN